MQIQSPEWTPRKFGLYSVINRRGAIPTGVLAAMEVTWEINCGQVELLPADCDTNYDKQPFDISYGQGAPFLSYSAAECKPMMDTSQAARDMHIRGLESALEEAVAADFATAQAVTATSSDPEALLPVIEAHPALDNALRTILAPRDWVLRAMGQRLVFQVGDHLETGLGSLVGAMASRFGSQVLVTGTIDYYEDEKFTAQTFDPKNNNQYDLVEQAHLFTYGCAKLKADIT